MKYFAYILLQPGYQIDIADSYYQLQSLTSSIKILPDEISDKKNHMVSTIFMGKTMSQLHTKANTISSLIFCQFKRSMTTAFLACVICTQFLVSSVQADDSGMADLKKVLQGQIEMMKPDLQKEVKGLSTDTKMLLMSILAMHSQYSDKATLRQVMLEVLADYQSIVMGIMTDSSEMTADAARRLANHRIPVGGLLPYMGMENINDDRLAVLAGFNDTVEGNAIKLAEAAGNGDMATAAMLLGTIGSGCVGCHAVFRPGIPGKSDLLR
ncbi:MAG: hypothetical protein AB2810_21150 [Candidatus Thiodiazotropha endolucinida]